MINLLKSNDRGRANHGWLDARHTFSFADYDNPDRVHFQALRVINEDRVAPGRGFGMHPHRDMEIITYVISGALRHSDSMGNTAVMRDGDVQRISAGTGILHSEVNASATEPVHLLQIWLVPDHAKAKPGYAEKSFGQAKPGKLHLVASKTGREDSVPINQDTSVYLGKLKLGDSISHALDTGRHGWLQVIRGDLDLNGNRLQPGDAAAISGIDLLKISAVTPSDFLLFDLNELD